MLWQPRHPFDEPDAITQTVIYDLRDEFELRAYNALLQAEGHSIKITDTDTKYVQEKVTFDRNGVELDRVAEKYLVTVKYRVRPGTKLPAGSGARLPRLSRADEDE